MKRISNWFFGSFFRTLGRILVYIFIGYIISLLLKDIKLPKLSISNLLYMDVQAETFTNNNYMSWQLNKNGTKLNGGNNPFYTSVDNLVDYGSYDLYLFYNNYTAYTNYFYDVTLTIYFDSSFIFANRVTSCNLYIDGATNQTSDGCRIVDITDNSITIANYNIQTLSGTGTFTNQFSLNVHQNNEITVFQVNSFKLDIVAKEDKSITSETFGNAINNVINNQNSNTQNIINNQNANTQDVKDTLTDDDPPTNLDSLSNSAGWLPAGPVDSILNLPLSFLTNLNTNLSKSCQPVELPLPFIDKTLPLPCVNLLYSQIDGVTPWINTVGIIASAFMLFGYLISLYKYVDDTLTFRENNYLDNWSGL